MSTTPTLCQGLQSCVQRVLMHQLPWHHKQTDLIFGGAEPEKAYVYPLSNSFLAAKSLDMCTESLGSETGSGIDESPSHHHPTIEGSGGAQKKAAAKAIKKVKFPPPLTSFSESGGFQVQTRGEGGRLVIKAFAVSSCFREERGGGRLRLSLIRDGGDEEEEVVNFGGDGRVSCNEEEEEEVVVRENADGGGDGRLSRNEGEEVVDQENAAAAGEEGERVGCMIGVGEWSSSRCNGDRSSRERLQSLPFCVAIS